MSELYKCEIGISNEDEQIEACEAIVSEKVAKYSKEKFGKIICYDCQKSNPIALGYIEKQQEKKIKQPKDVTKDYKGKWQDDMINFETLLNEAHDKFKDRFSIHTELQDFNMEKKWAVVHATVTVYGEKNRDDVQIFQGTGDSSQDNLTEMIKPHFLRMAETRAIARALRWATNNASTAEEEK